MLRDSEASVSTIAAQAGYTSEFAFAKAFKREHGIAPGGYRRMATAVPAGAPAPASAE
jgi:AraC-like DNA-binding protein